ncbi:TPA_asm: hypothetical protein [ssRNA phage Gerhypos.3_1]|uniref:Uncharacterized protein n=2 Tax=Fiersviridae TaxID=2842319 RepID=A0A8S5L0X9_9VIRU|nr:hypothetical protein QIM05_gp2 [ssRNA phage Gerhypos.3_1]QDH88006.1 MAG: hypothetical protein H3Bulk40516_000005 [Leviviridae sp.]DAD51289.1 TPA_asm: hypothetical protein [ssRNA phage Gerhypos.3_1]
MNLSSRINSQLRLLVLTKCGCNHSAQSCALFLDGEHSCNVHQEIFLLNL